MLLHSSGSAEVPVNVRGSLEAAHDAIHTFFLLYAIVQSEATVWWVFNHRAFLEALCIGNILRQQAQDPDGRDALAKDPLFVRAKADIRTSPPLFYLLMAGLANALCSADDRYHAEDERGRTWVGGGEDESFGAEYISVTCV
jgi:hypothetical protein